METCVRNLSFIHHLTALSPLDSRVDSIEKGRRRAGLQVVDPLEEELVCPKPRRMSLYCCAHDVMRPLQQWQSVSRTAECDAGYEILEIFLNKGACGEGEILNVGCSPPFCSPPKRTGNPVVHDVHFRSRACPPASLVKPKMSTPASFSSSPSVRIEGFDYPRRESCCDVHTSA